MQPIKDYEVPKVQQDQKTNEDVDNTPKGPNQKRKEPTYDTDTESETGETGNINEMNESGDQLGISTQNMADPESEVTVADPETGTSAHKPS